MSKDLFKWIKNSISKNDSLYLHELIWSIDAKHKSIFTLEEINNALVKINGIIKVYRGNEIEFVKNGNNKSELVSHEDIDKGLVIYNNLVDNILNKK